MVAQIAWWGLLAFWLYEGLSPILRIDGRPRPYTPSVVLVQVLLLLATITALFLIGLPQGLGILIWGFFVLRAAISAVFLVYKTNQIQDEITAEIASLALTMYGISILGLWLIRPF